MELESATVKILVELDEISSKWDPKLQNIFKNFTSIPLEIPFFKSGSVRELHPDNRDGDRIEATIYYVVNWLETCFGKFFSREYFEAIAAHTVSYLIWILPEMEIDGEGFLRTATIFVIGILVDDIGDGVAVAGKISKGMNYVPEVFYKLQNKALQLCCKIGYDGDIARKLGNGGDPLTKALMDAFSDQIEKIIGPGPNYWGIERQRALYSVFIGINSCERWVVENVDPFGDRETVVPSFDMYRNFRGDVSTCSSFAEACYIRDFEQIPSYLARNPVLLHWEGVANRIFACFNDILGFRKDVRKGCTEGIVMFKIIKGGLSVEEAVMEEAAILKEAIPDYLHLRRQIWVEHREIQEYVKIMDNLLFGHLFTFMHSERYGMKDCLEVEYMKNNNL